MSLSLLIDNVEYAPSLVPGSLSIEDAIGERSILSFTLRIDRGTVFESGEEVILTEEGVRLYGGEIEEVDEARMAEASADRLVLAFKCTDWHAILDRRIVAKSWTNTTIGTMITELIADYLAEEGITAGTIDGDLSVASARFPYQSATTVLEALGEKTGHNWWIDSDKVLHFVERSSVTAPWALDDDAPVRNVRVVKHRRDYRNREFIKGGKAVTDPQTERFKGDGETKTFTVGYGVAAVPTVTVDGVAKTVGIQGVDTGKDWYYKINEKTLSQDSTGTALTSTQVLQVAYQGYYDIVIIVSDQEEVMKCQDDVSEGTGYHDHVTQDESVTSIIAATELASEKLRRYAKKGRTVSFETFDPGLRSGQIITITLPEHDLNVVEYLITRATYVEVYAEDAEGVTSQYLWTVECVSGESNSGWTDFFKKLVNRNQTFVFMENQKEEEILVIPLSYSKTWVSGDSPNLFKPLYPGNATFPSATLLPMFDPETRIKYVAWYDSTGEIGRKPVVRTTVATGPDRLTTIAFIGMPEGVGQITHLGWWGGFWVSDTIGTGTEVARVAYSHLKTNLEAFQITREDTKGF